MKWIAMIAFALILASLGVALLAMLKSPGTSPTRAKRMARALTLRVLLSVLLFLAILLAWSLGWIQPTGIAPGR